MKNILKIILVIVPAFFPLLLNACKTTSYQVTDKDKGTNLELSSAAVTNNPQSQTNEALGVIKKRGIKRTSDKIIVKKQAEDIPRVTISDEMRKQMLLDAKRATKEQRHEEAIKIADAILKDKPYDESALASKENAQLLIEDKRHNVVMNQLDNLNIQERNKYLENLKEQAIPYNDLMQFTTEDKWEDIKKRVMREDANERLDENREYTERLQVVPSPSRNLLSQEMRDSLNKKISIEFIDTPLRDVVAFLQEKTKINFVLDRDAADTNVDIKLDDVPVSVILEYILPDGIDRVVKGDVVHITLDPLELRVYDVRDLLINLEDRESLSIQAGGPAVGGEQIAFSAGESKDAYVRVQEIIDLITNTIEPASWSANGGRGRIAAREGMLGDVVITHVAGIHKQTEDLLAALRSSADLQIAIEARFIQVSDNFLEEFGHNFIDFDTTVSEDGKTKNDGIFNEGTDIFAGTGVTSGTAGLNLTWQIFEGFFLKGFLRAVQESDEAETITAPKITLSNTQRGTIKVVTTFSYIESFDIVSQVPEPVIEEIDDGTTFSVRPIVSADRKYVYLEVHPVITSVTFDEETFETAVGGPVGGVGATAINTIQLPITVKQELSVTVCVPDKGILMIGGLGKSTERKTSQGTPILSKIPIIKRFFSSDTIDRDTALDDNLIIMIKPTILIRDEEENRAFAKGGKEPRFRNPLRETQ